VIEKKEPKKSLLFDIERDFLAGFCDLVVEAVGLFFPFLLLFIHILKQPICSLASQHFLLKTLPTTLCLK
jgi:hypothetical protein